MKCPIDRRFVNEESGSVKLYYEPGMTTKVAAFSQKSHVNCSPGHFCTDGNSFTLFVISSANVVRVSGSSWTSSSHALQTK